MTFEKEVLEARKRVMGMDAIDGFKNRHLLTVLAALEAGLKTPSNKCQYDAFVMLQDLVASNRKSRKTSVKVSGV